ncbi:hypothetical protein KY321_05255 [Candidatus Woesearchaeota archaeon]|nr:hypothetical protein [Candidatus Woesearchaeota archaeon]
MYEEIPPMDSRRVREKFASQISNMLDENSFWDVTGAGFIPGFIVRPDYNCKLKKNGCEFTKVVYILGDPKGMKGISIAAWNNVEDTKFYNSLINVLGYTVSSSMEEHLIYIKKPINATKELIFQLSLLEELVKK